MSEFPFNERNFTPFDTMNLKNNESIRVTSYNILADSLFELNNSVKSYTKLDIRRKKILLELKNLNSDIICLQEFENDKIYINELNKLGYEVSFKIREGVSHKDGCALLWKPEKFQLENLHSLVMNSNSDSNIYNRDNVCIFAILTLKSNPSNVFIVGSTHILFNNKRGDIKIAQVFQILNCLAQLKDIYSKNHKFVNIILGGDFNSSPCSAIYELITQGKLDWKDLDYKNISGQSTGNFFKYDLNSNYFFTDLLNNNTKKFNKSMLNKSKFNNNNNNAWARELKECQLVYEDELFYLSPVQNYSDFETILFPLKLKSAYSQNFKNLMDFLKNKEEKSILDNFIDKNLKVFEIYGVKLNENKFEDFCKLSQNLTLEPAFTFYNHELMNTFDFIFYEGNIEVVRVLDLPKIKMLINIEPCPNKIYPSDHFSITADFIFNN